jgi:hypothetical protein
MPFVVIAGGSSMAGPEHGMAEGGGLGRLRASNADRERVIDTLKAAYVYGLVTKDEFEARVSQTFAARTYAELAETTADIPPGLAPAPPPLRRPEPARANAPVAAGDRAIMATAIVAGLTLVASVFAAPAVAGFPLAGLLVLAGVGSASVSMFLFAIQMRSRRVKRPGGQVPPPRGADFAPSDAHQAVSATPADRLPPAARPRRSKADAARRHSLRPQLSS